LAFTLDHRRDDQGREMDVVRVLGAQGIAQAMHRVLEAQ
jgi:hypothetical protein